MKMIVFALVCLLVNTYAFADIRGDFDSLHEERVKCKKSYDEFYNMYTNEFESAVQRSSNCQLINAYEDVREVQQLWHEGWAFFVCGAVALFEGEPKFTVVPGVIEKINTIEERLEEKYFQMKLYVDKIQDKKLQQDFSKFVGDSKREFKALRRYSAVLTNY